VRGGAAGGLSSGGTVFRRVNFRRIGGLALRRTALLLFAAYVVAYIAFRLLNTEVWAADGKAYVIFPANFTPIYYAFRPLSYADGMLTGMGAHIGPHQ
jgi:hypothetical protein